MKVSISEKIQSTIDAAKFLENAVASMKANEECSKEKAEVAIVAMKNCDSISLSTAAKVADEQEGLTPQAKITMAVLYLT